MRRQGARGDPGRRRHRPRRLSRRRLRLRDPVADPAGDAPAARRAGAHAAHRPPRDRVVSEFRPLADPAAAPARRPHAAHRQPAVYAGTTRRTSTSAPSRTSASSARSAGAKMERRWRSTPGARRCGSMRRGGSGICSASRRCSCSAARADVRQPHCNEFSIQPCVLRSRDRYDREHSPDRRGVLPGIHRARHRARGVDDRRRRANGWCRARSISSRSSATGAARTPCLAGYREIAQHLDITGYQVEKLLVDGDRAAALIRLHLDRARDRQGHERHGHRSSRASAPARSSRCMP